MAMLEKHLLNFNKEVIRMQEQRKFRIFKMVGQFLRKILKWIIRYFAFE